MTAHSNNSNNGSNKKSKKIKPKTAAQKAAEAARKALMTARENEYRPQLVQLVGELGITLTQQQMDGLVQDSCLQSTLPTAEEVREYLTLWGVRSHVDSSHQVVPHLRLVEVEK